MTLDLSILSEIIVVVFKCIDLIKCKNLSKVVFVNNPYFFCRYNE